MPIQLTLVVADDWTADRVQLESIRQWLAVHVRQNDTQVALAHRAGMSYRQLRYFMAKLQTTLVALFEVKHSGVTAEEVPAEPVEMLGTYSLEPCQFCGSVIEVHLHHVVNRYDSPVMVALCAKCHRKFHFLNKLYRPPQHKTAARRTTITKLVSSS